MPKATPTGSPPGSGPPEGVPPATADVADAPQGSLDSEPQPEPGPAVAEPGPAEEPDDPCVWGFQGFIVCPPNQLSPPGILEAALPGPRQRIVIIILVSVVCATIRQPDMPGLSHIID